MKTAARSQTLHGGSHVTTSPDSFGVFRKYSSIPSHNPDDPNPFSDMPSTSPGVAPPQDLSVGSNLEVSSATRNSNPFASSENLSEDIMFNWWFQKGSHDGITCLNDLVKDMVNNPYFDLSQLENFNAVSALHRFDKRHCSSKSGTTPHPVMAGRMVW